MKSFITKILIIAILVACFGSGVWHAINYYEDRIVEKVIELIETSEFIDDIKIMIQDTIKQVVTDLLKEEFDELQNSEVVTSITP